MDKSNRRRKCIDKNVALEDRNIIVKSALAIFIGLFFLVLICFLDTRICKENNEWYFDYIRPLGNSLSTSAIILGTGTLLLDLYGYLAYFRKRLAETFSEETMINLLSPEYKYKMKLNLLKSIYQPDTIDSEELLSLFDYKLVNLLESYYYSEYSLFVTCAIEEIEGRKYIKKRITRIVVYQEINSKNKNTFKDLLEIKCYDISEGVKSLEVKTVKINGDPLSEGKKYKVLQNPCSENRYGPSEHIMLCQLVSEMEINKCTKVVLEYETLVPINDSEYSVRINLPCKHMRCIFTFQPSKLEVSAKGFNFETSNADGFDVVRHNGFCSIESLDWVLPGEGILFLIKETDN